ncbi:hypothetical protein CcI49_02875 [Frankia sp. CcI49]|uniref:hypothetical protein n=1 Tax=Frankia sp. CcI49 TaxID=1745382 RepID=UPI000976FC78|nr:hypothetical protein [Frankia sp. CcI49]ONH62338.1 hypothetical protein CcI49_02875 [Frankia sp. CcI49]
MARRAVIRDRAEAAAGEILDLLDRADVLAEDSLLGRDRDYEERMGPIIAGARRHILDLDDAEVRRRLAFVIEILYHSDYAHMPGEPHTVLWDIVFEGRGVLGAHRRGEKLPAEPDVLDRYRAGLERLATEREERRARRDEDQGD